MTKALSKIVRSRWMTQIGITVIASGMASGAIVQSSALAQITPDDTLGEERSIVVEDLLPGVDGIAGGAARGSNLFHSFRRFNVGEGRSAYFDNPEGILNIFTRVTGRDPSNILGRLGVLGDANLFLINPNGVVFGENASLDVQGSFVATTANALQFGQQGFFSATNPESPALLTINPSALLFNQVAPGNIANFSRSPAGTQPSGDPELGLRVPDGESLLLVGGDILMDGGRVNALGGRIELAGLAAPGAIGLNIDASADDGDSSVVRLTVPADLPLADVTLLNDGRASVRGTGGGELVVNADQVSGISGGRLVGGSQVSSDAGRVIVNANDIFLSGIGADGIRSSIGNQSGDIEINTGTLTLENTAFVFTSNVVTQRPPGSIQINARTAVNLDGDSTILVGGSGNDGITIATPNLTLQNGSEITVLSTNLAGQNGDIVISAPGAVTVLNSSQILNTAGYDPNAPTDLLRTSSSGNVTIQTGQLTIAQNSNISASSLLTLGRAGNIAIQADQVTVRDGSRIDAVAFGGEGGDITVTANQFLAQRGGSLRTNAVNVLRFTPASDPTIVLDNDLIAGRDQFVAAVERSGNLDRLTQQPSGRITVRTTGNLILDGQAATGSASAISTGSTAGTAGNITIDAQNIRVQNGAFIESTTNGSGSGGNLNLTARSIEITGFTAVPQPGTQVLLPSSVRTTAGFDAAGNAGNVTLQTDRLQVSNGAEIDTTANGQGQGGNIGITAGESIDLVGASDPQAPNRQSELSASSSGGGNAGNITLNTPRLNLQNGGRIAATTSGSGQGGDIVITADRVEFSATGNDRRTENQTNQITSSAGAGETGNAGDITISADSLRIRDGIISADTSGAGQGGTVRIAARDGIDIGEIDDRGSDLSPNGITTTTSGSGTAGDILITTDRLRVQNGSLVTAGTLGAGEGGNLIVRASTVTLSNISSLTTNTTNAGNAGGIFLTTDRLRLQAGGQIAANTSGLGNAGSIAIRANEIQITGISDDRSTVSAISSISSRLGESGNAGTILIATDRLNLSEGGQIAALTLGTGQGGSLTIGARDAITLSGSAQSTEGTIFPSSLRTDTGGAGNAGDITVFTDRLQLQNEGEISAQSVGSGTGGTIRIAAENLSLTAGASVSARSQNTGRAGDIQIQSAGQVSLNNSNLVTAADRASGGAISVQAGSIRLQDSNIQTNVDQGRETGGNISLTANSILAFDDSNILAFARDGRGGNITLDTPVFLGESYEPGGNTAIANLTTNDRVDVNASGSLESGIIRLPDASFIRNSLAEIPDNTIDPDQLIANSCIARSPGGGTFIITGSGGLPERPGAGAEFSYPTGDVQAIPDDRSRDQSSESSRQSAQSIVEPQGVFQLPDGRIVMSRFCDGELQ